MKRRQFVQTAATAVAVWWLGGCKDEPEPAADAGRKAPEPPRQCGRFAPAATEAGLHSLTKKEAAVLDAALERLLPGDVPPGTPGARDAKVLRFIDLELAKPHFAGLAREIKRGALALDKVATSEPEGDSFHKLPAARQDAILERFQRGAVTIGPLDGARFFELLLTLALEGFLGAPSWGGNAERVVWQSIGHTMPCVGNAR